MRITGIVGALATVIALAGCSGSPRAARPEAPAHVLVILIDTLRADHLGAYGYERNTSPTIDRLAAEGVVFEHARGNSTYTGEVVSTLFSGLLPTVNPTGTGWYAMPSPGRANLAQRFDAAGYQTGCFTNSPILAMPGYFDGFDESECYQEDFSQAPLTGTLTDRALDFITRHKDGKTLTYLHYIEPHTPYVPPDQYVARFVEPVPPKRCNLSRDVQGNLRALLAAGFGPGDPCFDDLVLRYDAEIALVDDHIGRLLHALEAQGILDDTLVVITADHGEEFLEHAFMEHAWNLYDEVMHVPLIFWRPGMLSPGRRTDLVSLVDLLPTLLAFIGLPGTPDDFDGAPLFALSPDNDWKASESTRRHYASLLVETRALLHCVIDGNLKYIAAPRYLTPEECDIFYTKQRPLRNTLVAGEWHRYNYWSPPVQEMLFDLSVDPGETNNLASSRPEELARMREHLQALEARSKNAYPRRYVDEDRLTLEFVENLPKDAGQELPPEEASFISNHPYFSSNGKDAPDQSAIDALDALGYMGSDEK